MICATVLSFLETIIFHKKLDKPGCFNIIFPFTPNQPEKMYLRQQLEISSRKSRWQTNVLEKKQNFKQFLPGGLLFVAYFSPIVVDAAPTTTTIIVSIITASVTDTIGQPKKEQL